MILNGKQAEKEIKGIGKKMLAKIDELLTTGKLDRLERERNDKTQQAVTQLQRVSGIGSVRAMELRIGGHNYVIVAAGAWAATVISANGKKLQSIDFPEPPNHEVLVMDFNSDGLNDLVVCTGEGFYGFAQVRHFSTVPFTGLLACLIVAMISVYVSIHGGAGGKASRGGARGQAKARAFNKD